MLSKRFFSSLTAAALAMAIVGSPALAQEKEHKEQHKNETKVKGEQPREVGKKQDGKKEGVAVGGTAPTFTIRDTDNKEVSLSSILGDGNIVVLQWFNPDCPFVVKHYKETKTFNDLHAKYSGKKVVFLAINSGAPGQQGTGLKRNQEAKKEWSIPYPILLDESGETGKAYGAKNTPGMYIVTPDGKIAYKGAIDDDNSAKGPGKTNYVANALDEILAKKPVTTTETKPYGCSVKYANK